MSTPTYTIYHAGGRTTVKSIVIFGYKLCKCLFFKRYSELQICKQEVKFLCISPMGLDNPTQLLVAKTVIPACRKISLDYRK
jgi:hypothetical protein